MTNQPPNFERAYPRLDERAEVLEFLRESREDIEAGRTQPVLEALERLAKKHKLNRKDL